jgi:hypothetical protein
MDFIEREGAVSDELTSGLLAISEAGRPLRVKHAAKTRETRGQFRRIGVANSREIRWRKPVKSAPITLYNANAHRSQAWLWLGIGAFILLALVPTSLFLTKHRPTRDLVIAEEGLWHDGGLMRLRTVYWSEVAKLDRHGKILRLILVDPTAYFAARPGGGLSFGRPKYVPLQLDVYTLPAEETAQVITRQFEAWGARRR